MTSQLHVPHKTLQSVSNAVKFSDVSTDRKSVS